MQENPEYADVQLLLADWDIHKNTPLRKELKVVRRSTLIMFRDGEEVARVLAQTNKDVIEDLFLAAVG